jgi:hypothetical protein
VSGGWPSASLLARVYARSLPIEWLCALILPRLVRMLDVLAASFQGVCDGVKCVAVNVVSVGGWAVHEALDKAE